MPHLSQGKLNELLTEPQRASNDGDYNALFFVQYLKAFQIEPRYKTIALIRKASLTPSKLEGVKAVEDLLTVQGVTLLDRIVARDLAFVEFYRLVGSRYENLAMKKNGIMPELQDVRELLVQKEEEIKANLL